jgi:hypothetical protein
MPEYDDYQAAPWSAADTFASARAQYDANAGRGYQDAVAKGVTANDLVPDHLVCEAMAPIAIYCDQTGSMGESPAVIFSKLGYLDNEARYYFGHDYAISFGAFGDAQNNEHYPVQIRPFVKEAALQLELKELKIEGNGGGNYIESSELPALYALKNISMPNAIKPVLILITDEKCYDVITPEHAKQWAKVDLAERMTAKQLFDALKKKWSVYLIRLPYGGRIPSDDNESSTDRAHRLHWEALVGADHMAYLPDASRVVDVIFGIFAQETGKIDEFRDELNSRQLKDQDGDKKVATVLKALKTIHVDDASVQKLPGNAGSVRKLANPDKTQHSKLRGADDTQTRKSKRLLDD